MSYLEMDGGMSGFTQAIISFWFRVPQKTIDEAANDPVEEPDGIESENDEGEHKAEPNLRYIIPFITFGTEGMQRRNGGTDNPSRDEMNGGKIDWKPGKANTETPSFIGLKCTKGETAKDPSTACLVIHLQMSGFGSGSGGFYDPPDFKQVPPPVPPPPPPALPPSRLPFTQTSKGGISASAIWHEEMIHIEVPNRIPDQTGGVPPGEVEADHWHHVLISFDITDGFASEHVEQSMTGPRRAPKIKGGKMWLAYDDENYDGYSFGQASPRFMYSGVLTTTDANKAYAPNLIATPSTFSATWMYAVHSQQQFYDHGLPTGAQTYVMEYRGGAFYAFDPSRPPGAPGNPGNPDAVPPIPPTVTNNGGYYLVSNSYLGGGWKYTKPKIITDKKPIGIPSSEDYVDRIHRIEMAELQFFTDVTIDTSKKDNRRLFIDDEGKPVKPKVAEVGLGTKPVILLHTSGKWISGKNTGSLALDQNNQPNPAGFFVPEALIRRYKPNPSLHGPQKPGEKI